jgi:hypothetical protein
MRGRPAFRRACVRGAEIGRSVSRVDGQQTRRTLGDDLYQVLGTATFGTADVKVITDQVRRGHTDEFPRAIDRMA